jgi:DNA-binding NarL/FixJ family response regulator
MTAAKVLIVSPTADLREGLSALIGSIPAVKLLDQEQDVGQTLHILEQHQPDLVVLDMGGLGEEALQILAFVHLHQLVMKILLLVEDMRQQTQAQVAGADVALIKGYPAHELLETVQALLAK